MKHLKMILAALTVAFAISASLPAVNTTNGIPPAIGSSGGTMNRDSALVFGNYPVATAGTAIKLTVLIVGGVTKGDALVLVAGKGCSKTATVGDVNFIGFAGDDTAYGEVCNVLTSGVTYARIGHTVTAGDRLVMSANPGFLTPTSAVTAAAYTPVSGTPIVARALVSKTYSSGSPTVLVTFGNKE